VRFCARRALPLGHSRTLSRRKEHPDWNDAPLCDQAALWEEGWDDRHDMPDLLVFRVCRGAAPKPIPPLNVDIALCQPIVTGVLNAPWFDAWVAWHRALGVEHLYFYTGGPEPADMHPVGMSYDWIDVGGWLNHFTTWSRAQLWSVHDCMFRARAQQVGWVIFMDVDELVHLPPGITLVSLSQEMEKEGKKGVSFGSVPYLSSMCHPKATEDMTPAQKVSWRALSAECQQWEGHPDVPIAACPSWQGRRKYFISTHATHKLHIHYPDIVPEQFIDLSTDDGYWLKHARGAPWGDGAKCDNPGCTLQPNGSLVCLASAIHCGSDCDPATANSNIKRADSLFILDSHL